MLDDWTAQWIAARPLKRATQNKLRYEVAIWRKCGGSDPPDGTVITNWQTAALASGLRARTINSVLSTVALLAKCGGLTLAYNPLPVRARPKFTPSLADIDRLIASAQPAVDRSANWWRRWLSFAYCTGLRRGDLLHLDGAQIRDGEVTITAEKTGKLQTIPLPRSLLQHLPPCSRFLFVSEKPLLRTLRDWCVVAGVPTITPQAVRRLSAREWERAHAGAGAVILGHSIPGWTKATASYLDSADLLRDGLPRFRLPQWLAPEVDDQQTLIEQIARLTAEQRASVQAVVAAMAK